jgi:hypothetical protein
LDRKYNCLAESENLCRETEIQNINIYQFDSNVSKIHFQAHVLFIKREFPQMRRVFNQTARQPKCTIYLVPKTLSSKHIKKIKFAYNHFRKTNKLWILHFRFPGIKNYY